MQIQTIVAKSAFKAGIWIAAALTFAAVQAEEVEAAETPAAFVEGTHYESVSMCRLKPGLKTNRRLR